MENKVKIGSVTLGDSRADYCTFGSGKTRVLMLPGVYIRDLIPAAEQVAAAYSALCADCTVTLLERRKTLPADVTVSDMARDAAEAIRQLDLAPCVVFGVSQGAMIAQELAAAHPEFAEKLVLGSCCSKTEADAKAVIERWTVLAEKGELDALNTEFVFRVYAPETIRQYGDLLTAGNVGATKEELSRFSAMTRACLTFDVVDRLGAISCPVFVIGSKGDMVFGEAAMKRTAGLINAELFLYDAFGHAVYDEAPDFKERILSFIKK